MSWGLRDIDHVVVRVADLAAGVHLYETLGFRVAPPREKPDPLDPAAAGKRAPFALRQILFQPFPGRDDIANFLVLQCIEDQLSVPASTAHIMGFMLDTEGVRTVVGFAEDLDSTKVAMEAGGIQVAPSAWTIESSWKDEATGELLPVRSQPCIALTRRIPFSVNAFKTETLETFWHRPWTEHPNGVLYLAGVTGVSDDVAHDAELMAGLVFGAEVEWDGPEIATVRPRDLFMRIVSPRGFASLYPGLDFSSERILPAYAGVTFAAASIADVRRILRNNGVTFEDTPTGGVVVPRQAAANTLIEFVSVDQ